jgi:hypothetical protein
MSCGSGYWDKGLVAQDSSTSLLIMSHDSVASMARKEFMIFRVRKYNDHK